MDALVSNASDEQQVKAAEKREKIVRNQDLDDMKFVLSSIQGRRLLWKMLEHCQIFGSIWSPSAQIHYLAGKQDVGHWIMSNITKADEEKYFQMMRESKQGDFKNG